MRPRTAPPTSRSITKTRPSTRTEDEEAFCSAVVWRRPTHLIKRCVALDRLEGNTAEDFLDAYSEKAPAVPMLSLFALMCTLVVMRRPAWALLRLRQLFLAIGVEERTAPRLRSGHALSFTKESGVRIHFPKLFRLALLLLGVRIFLVTFTTIRAGSTVLLCYRWGHGASRLHFGVYPPLKPSYKLRPDLKPHPQKASQTSSSLSSKSSLLLSPSGGCSSTRGLSPRWPSFSWFQG